MPTVTCTLCPHRCRLAPGEEGFCRTRANREGRLISLSYGRFVSLALDPIEKKPLYHFYPGSFILSLGSFGCNLRCPFCQNHEISQAGAGDLPARLLSPEELTELSLRLKSEGNIGVAFTYNEPLLNYEYLLEAAPILGGRGAKVVLVTNGQLAEAPFRKLLPHIDALNIDLKAFRQDFYDWLGGDLATVKQNIAAAVEAGVHVEVTTLVIPGKNDNPDEMEAEARWLAGLSPELPLHLSRYFPRYRLSLPPTPAETLQRLKKIARTHLKYVHLGNI